MNINHRRWICLGLLAALNMASIAHCRADDLYSFQKEISVGGEGGWDYLTVDESARRLYVAHHDKVDVIDLDKETVAGQITNTPGVHGFALASKMNRGFSSNGREGTVTVVDLKSFKTLDKLKVGKNPDAILVNPMNFELVVFNGRDPSMSVFEADDGDFLLTTNLPGKPEFAVMDPEAARIYVNLEDKSEIAVINAVAHTVSKRWPLAPGEEPTGLAIDLAHHRLFAGCGNKMLVMMDSATGKVIGSVPIGEGVDAVAFDPATRLVFSSNGEGTVTIAREETPDKLTVVQTLKTAPGARTMALDPKTHKIYLAATGPDGPQKPNSGGFKILVYGPEKPLTQ